MTILLLSLAFLSPLAGAACLVARDERLAGRISALAASLAFALSLAIAGGVLAAGPSIAVRGWLLADPLSALTLVIVSAAGCAAAWYAIHFMPGASRAMGVKGTPAQYHALYQALLGSVLLAAMSNNLGLLWIAIEASTLASALLVGFYSRPGAVEAAWKYLILCSVGITLALLATVLVFASSVGVFGEGAAGLQWAALRQVASQLDPRLVKLAFLFALAGYGTKAGLAPMHTWMPDAYGQAPTPVSALMAAGLGAASLVALLRFHSLCARCVGESYSGHLLMVFGLVSLAVSVPFLLIQGDYKRLLAYSSLENTGFVTLAIGFGAPLAIVGGLFHLLAQSLAKSLAFLVGGTLSVSYGSRRMDHWSGVLDASPSLGALFAVAGIALAGLPPTALFLSEWLSFHGGLQAGHAWPVLGALGALATIFVGLAFHWTRMGIGRARAGFADPLPASSRAPLWSLAAALLVLGAWIPSPLRQLLEQAAQVLRP